MVSFRCLIYNNSLQRIDTIYNIIMECLKQSYKYTLKQIKEYMNVSDAKWKRDRKKLLEHFSAYYQYHIQYDQSDRRKNLIVIDRIIDNNYSCLETIRQKYVKDRDNRYDQAIINTIEQDSLQTPKNISRIIKEKQYIKLLGHKDSTRYQITLVRTRKMFGSKVDDNDFDDILNHNRKGRIAKKIWCKLDSENNSYTQMKSEQIEEFYSLVSKQKNDQLQFQIKVNQAFENDQISKEERDQAIGQNTYYIYREAKRAFYSKHNYYPVLANLYQLFPDKIGEKKYENNNKSY